MPDPNNPFQYQYRPQDDPLTVANQFNVTPQQLLAANPGGTPFSVGQTIKIPQAPQAAFQYKQPIGPQPAPQPATPSLVNQGVPPSVVNAMNPSTAPATIPQNRGNPGIQMNMNLSKELQAQITSGMAPDTVPSAVLSLLNATPQSMAAAGYVLDPATKTWNKPGGEAATPPGTYDPTKPFGGFSPAGSDNTDYANTAAARAYAAAGTPFLQQQRWDPQARRYVSLGKLLKQGKLDLQGNWHRRRRGGGGGGGRQAQQAQAAQDYTLANSMINFSASSG
jgi:hypothetical protein